MKISRRFVSLSVILLIMLSLLFFRDKGNSVDQKENLEVYFLDLNDTPIKDSELGRFKQYPNLQYLHLNNTQISDAGLVHLAKITRLHSLFLDRTQVSDVGLKSLKGRTNFLRLGLRDTKITDAGLVYLEGMTRLESLRLSDTKISDAGLVHLKGLTKLKSLYISNTQVTDAGLKHLVGLTNIEGLNLGKTQVSGVGLQHLEAFTKLRSLNLDNTQITDAGLGYLKVFTKLSSLHLDNTQITDAGLEYLKGFAELRILHLDHTHITGSGLEHLRGMTNLEQLYLTNTPVSDAGLEHLRGMTELERIYLFGCTHITEQGINRLHETIPRCKINNKRLNERADSRMKSVAQKNRPTKKPTAPKIHPSRIPALVKTLNDPEERLRHWGSPPGGRYPEIFGEMNKLKDHPEANAMRESLESLKLHEDQHIRLWASYALRTGDSWPILPLPKGIKPKPTSYWVGHLDYSDSLVRRWAVYTLGRNAKDAGTVVPELLKFLQHDDEGLQLESARAVGEFGSAAMLATPPLTELASHKNHEVRMAAARSLNKIDSVAAVPVLIEQLDAEIDHVSKSAKHLLVAMTAAELLGKMGPPAIAAAPSLEKALQGSDINIRITAALALNRVRPNSEASVTTLKDAMKHQHRGFRRQALIALSKIQGEQSVRSIADALSDDHKSVRDAAGSLVGKALTDELLEDANLVREISSALLKAIESDEDVAKNAIRGLTDLFDKLRAIGSLETADDVIELAVPLLTERLEWDVDWQVRTNAANALRILGPRAKSAIPALIDLLKVDVSESGPRQASLQAARAIGEFNESTSQVPEQLSNYRLFTALDRDWDSQLTQEELGNAPSIQHDIQRTEVAVTYPLDKEEFSNLWRQVLDSPAPTNDHPAVDANSNRHALRFNDGNCRVYIPTLWYSGNHPITLELWLRGRGHSVCTWRPGGLGLITGTDYIKFGLHDQAEYKEIMHKGRWSESETSHIAGTFDGQKMRFFLNGRQEPMEITIDGRFMESSLPIMIGAIPVSGSIPGQNVWKIYNGVIDEVRISNVVRYSADFEPQTRFEPDEATMALYHFDVGEGKLAIDSSGNNHHGQIWEAEWIEEFPHESGQVDFDIYSRRFFASKMTDTDMAKIKEMTQIEELGLPDSQVTDAGLEHLKGLIGLQWLYLNNSQVTDAGLEYLKGLTGLQRLYLNNTQVTDAGLEYLKGMTSLQRLYLNNTQVTDDGLKHLEGLTSLQQLNVNNIQITDVGLVHLKGLTRLQSLGLENPQITDAGLKHIEGLANVQLLALANTQISDAGLKLLKGLTSLQRLYLDNTQATDAGMVHLKGMNALEELSLDGTRVMDAGLEKLEGLNNLQLLSLINCQTTDTGLKYLKGMTGLEKLELENTQVTDAGLEHLKGLTKLQELNLRDTQVTDEGVRELQEVLPNCEIHR